IHLRPDYVVLTSLHYARAYRQRDDDVALWNTVRRGVLPYRLAERFRAEYLNWWFYRNLDPMYEGYFISPTIEIYRRLDLAEEPASTVSGIRLPPPGHSRGRYVTYLPTR